MNSPTSQREMPSNLQLLDMAREVLLVCCDKSLGDILQDLAMTRSSEITINRIFDGQFLSPLTPSLATAPTVARAPRVMPPDEKVVDLISSSEDEDPIKDEFGPRRLQKPKPGPNHDTFNLEDVLGHRMYGEKDRIKDRPAMKKEDSWPIEAETPYDNMDDYQPWHDDNYMREDSPPRDESREPTAIDLQFNPRKKWEKSSKKTAAGSLPEQDPLDDWDFDVPEPTRASAILDRPSQQASKTTKSIGATSTSQRVASTKVPTLDWSDDDLDWTRTSQYSPPPVSRRRSPLPSDLLATASDTGRYRENSDDRPHSTPKSPKSQNWDDIANSSLSPPTMFQDDTDSEQELLMLDVFSGNPKRKGMKSRSGSRLNQAKKRPRASTPDLHEWDIDEGNSASGSLQDEITKKSSRARTIDDDISNESKEEKRKEREAAATARKAAKEAEQRRKREKKEQAKKEKEKERLAEKKAARDMKIANRLTTKAEGVKEMILCIDETLLTTGFGQATQDYLTMLDCHIQKQRTVPGDNIDPSTGQNIMFWRRTVKSRFDEEQDMFVLLQTPEIDLEPFALIYISGSDFAAMIQQGRLRPELASLKRELRIRVNKEKMKQLHENPERDARLADKQKQRVIYLIDGLEAHLRSLKKVTTKKFQQAVLADMGHQQAGPHSSVDQASTVDEERIEQELLWLQLEQDCLVMHAEDDDESALILVSLTEQIGLRPYKESRKSKLNVCVEGIKSGTDPSDTWSKSLQEIRMVTAAVANSIVEEYPTLKCLYEGYRKCKTRQEAEQMLEGIVVSGRRSLGRFLSRKIFDVFMSEDPNMAVS